LSFVKEETEGLGGAQRGGFRITASGRREKKYKSSTSTRGWAAFEVKNFLSQQRGQNSDQEKKTPMAATKTYLELASFVAHRVGEEAVKN